MCVTTPTDSATLSTVDELADLGWELNANHYRAVCLASRYDEELDWFDQGHPNAAVGIARRLEIHTATAREWIRVGHALHSLPVTRAAFAANAISYAKVQILTRRAEPHNEADLLELAQNRSANRLTAAVARHLATDEDEAQQDARQHQARSLTNHLDDDGMMVIRIVLPPTVGQPVLAAVDKLVDRIAKAPLDNHQPDDQPLPQPRESDLEGSHEPSSSSVVVEPASSDPSANGSEPRPTGADWSTNVGPGKRANNTLATTLRELRRRWQPGADDDWMIPTVAQQRADAFTVLFLDLDIDLTTEVVIHMRGDGNTFDDGTPITTNAITRQLDDAFIRLLLHDAERTPIDATNRRRHPTTRQKRVAMERHNNECIDCQSTLLIELDHNPPYSNTRHTVSTELEPRCAPCHRARHRRDEAAA